MPDSRAKASPGVAPFPSSSSPPHLADGDRILEDELRMRSNQQALLVEVNAALAAAIDVERVLGQILSRLQERAHLAYAAIFLLSPEERLLRCAADSGYSTPEAYRVLALDGPGLVAWAARAAEAVYVPDVSRDHRYLCGEPKAKSEYAVPLLAGSSVVGVLDIESDQFDGIRAVTRKLVDQIAGPAALAIERSELYKKLRASEERFRSVFEQNYFGVALCNLEGQLSAVNPAFAQLLGYQPEELRGKHLTEITHPDDRAENLARYRQLQEGQITRSTVAKRYLRKSGETLWCISIVSVIQDPEGRPIYFLAMVEDVTERKKNEQEFAQLQKQLLQAQKMEAIGALAGGLAHDFNNFLGAILGFASLIRLRLGDQNPLMEPVRMIEQSAQLAANVARNLLGLARQEEHRPDPASVREILDRVLTIVTRTFDRRIRVEARQENELPLIEADPGQLDQAILNLCINARDAMPVGGELTIESSVETLDEENTLRPPHCPPGRYVRIAVRDTGTGIDTEVMQHLFEPFFTTKGPGQGSGLGLSMVYRIVNNHRGFVRVESQLGCGSQFTVYLPAAHEPAKTAQEEKLSRVERGTGTVLVVDDEPLVLAFAQQGLEKLGYKVLTADSGRAACEIFAARRAEIDCILLDVVMPEVSGLEIFQRLREINPKVRVILSSGYNAGRVERQAREIGAAEFIGKPYSLESLSQVLKKAQQNLAAGCRTGA